MVDDADIVPTDLGLDAVALKRGNDVESVKSKDVGIVFGGVAHDDVVDVQSGHATSR